MPKLTLSLKERLARMSRLDPVTGCILWTGGKAGGGYGRIHVDGRSKPAHRVSYELVHGPVPAELVMDHLCRVPACINPEHLEPVTMAVNIERGNNPLRDATHCKWGHAFDPKNTRTKDGRYRECRACAADRNRRERAARRSGPPSDPIPCPKCDRPQASKDTLRSHLRRWCKVALPEARETRFQLTSEEIAEANREAIELIREASETPKEAVMSCGHTVSWHALKGRGPEPGACGYVDPATLRKCPSCGAGNCNGGAH